MSNFVIEGCGSAEGNPSSATGEELLAAALNEAGLLAPETTINGRSARGLLEAWNRKTSRFDDMSRLGVILLKQGLLTETELDRALRLQNERKGLLLGEALIELGLCTLPEIEKILGTQVRLREDMKDLAKFRARIDTIKERLRLYL